MEQLNNLVSPPDEHFENQLQSFFKPYLTPTSSKSLKTSQAVYHVAVLNPASSRYLQEIQRGFMETLRTISSTIIKYTVFDGENSPLRIRKHIDTIITHNFDLIFTVGATCTAMAKQVTLYKRKIIPIVFSAVETPSRYYFVESQTRPGYHVTGSAAEPQTRYLEQLSLLLTLKPETKRVLFPFNPLNGSVYTEERNISLIRNFLAQKNIELIVVSSFEKKDFLEKVAAQITHVDVLLANRDFMVIDSLDHLVSLCNKNKVTLITCDIYGVEKGAALSYGHHEFNMGQAAAYHAKIILEQHYHPRELPVITPQSNYRLKINPKTLGLQGLNLDPRLLFLIQHGHLS